jgi:phage terminase large subunit
MNRIKINKKYQPIYTTKDRYIYLSGGRGSSKSFTVADFIGRLSFEEGHKILYTRYTLTSADKSIIPEFVEKLELQGTRSLFYITKDSIVNTRTGSEIIFSGIKTSSGNQTARLKSIQGITTWIYDEFEEHPNEDSFDDIDLSIRQKGVQNRVILISNALHKQSWQYKRFFEKEPNVTHIYTTYLDNYDNLSDSFLEKADEVFNSNKTKYDKNFLGLHYDDLDGALWKFNLIERNRVKFSPEYFDRIVVAVDPAVTSNENSDETGIVVVARKGDDGYVLDDGSGKYSPNEWAVKTSALYKKNKADRVIGEVNNGGDLIETNLRVVDKFISYKSVRASRGKAIRAEPIVSLYEQNRIHHVGYFPELEAELTTWVPNKGESPNRLDALVWGLSELFAEEEKFTEKIQTGFINI